jgi:tRNA(fMet)-specific endonuclease VapC
VSFLLDTDICSAHLRQTAAAVTGKFLQYASRLHVSVITAGEVHTWARRAKASPKRLQALDDFLRDVTILDINVAIAEQFGQVRAALLDAGRPCPDLDLLIASTALAHGLILVTHNVQDFLHVPGLQIEDWLKT